MNNSSCAALPVSELANNQQSVATGHGQPLPSQGDNTLTSPTKSEASEEAHQPRPAPAIPKFQTFGDDPTAFDDPTIYHIRDIHEGLDEDEKKDILGVTEYPHNDLHDKTPGTPPDRDFSNAKPSNQVSFQNFLNYLEPYVRPLTQEDIAFLEERGDRTAPFVIPRRGQQSYKEIWAEDEGAPPPPSTTRHHPPQPAGGMDSMTDETAADGTVSAGPSLSRLLSAMIPERRTPTTDAATNGDNTTANDTTDIAPDPSNPDSTRVPPPAAQMAEANQPGWKSAAPKMDYATMDQRLLQELRHIGFIDDDADPDYDGHYDDEVAARLRYLQEELKRVSISNGARKARVRDLANDAMAKQEFSAIADDIDAQLNQAYLKRHRNIGKGKKAPKRPGVPGSTLAGIAVSRPGLGEPIRTLMEKREQWREVLGPIVEFGTSELPRGSVFAEEEMREYWAREQEMWSETQD